VVGPVAGPSTLARRCNCPGGEPFGSGIIDCREPIERLPIICTPGKPRTKRIASWLVSYGLTLWLRLRTSSAKTFLEAGIALIGLKF
jgi:hypothetical protein